MSPVGAEKVKEYQRKYRRTHKQQIAEQKRKYRFRKAVEIYEYRCKKRDLLRGLTKYKLHEYKQWFYQGGEDEFFDKLDAKLGLTEK